ncbi:hypothetical protein ACA910_006973 [Epithemia clementina (nom. ined.)]
MTKVWVSVTGLELKSWLRYPQFMMYAAPSFMQAQASAGNIYAGVKNVGNIHHTLTVWKSRNDMLAYLRQGEHLKAMKISREVGKYGKVYGYESDSIPSWDEALKLWKEKGRVMLGKPKEGDSLGHHRFEPSKAEEIHEDATMVSRDIVA